VGFSTEAEMKAFLSQVSQKSYAEVFNIRSRVETSVWERTAITNLKEIIFGNENKYPNTKNVLYVHIPFCATRCDYCPYYTTPYSSAIVSEYLDALEKEIRNIKDTPYVKSTTFGSVYFGGGTPSVLSADNIKRITNTIFSSFKFEEGGEFSFESNPSTLTEDKIKALKSSGMNRVSLGIQTFNDRLLKEMNCAHTAEKAKRTINMLLDYGFVVNTDMIFGLIGQTKDDIEKDLQELNSFKYPHQVTLFPLRIATHTPLGEELQKKEGITISTHFKRLLEFDSYIEEIMAGNQFLREESPVFYHKVGSYDHKYHSTETRVIGIGSSAGTLLDEGEGCNFHDVHEYISAIQNDRSPAISGVTLTMQQAYERFVLYRIIYMNRSLPNFRGIVERNFYEHYGIPLGNIYDKVLDDMIKLRYIKKDTDKIEFTDRLWMILNKVKIGMPSIL